MNSEWTNWINELLAKTDIVQVISRYVQLSKKGNDYWACCPFHLEKEPSFKIYAGNQTFHCFGCKESGNAITFVSKMENIERIEAIKLLAQDAGMKLPQQNIRGKMSEEAFVLKRERLHLLLKEAARFYHGQLDTPAGKPYLDYLSLRGIDRSMITKFGLGAAPDWTNVIDYLHEKGFTNAEMKEAGVTDQKADRWYDVFRGRVMFPIISPMNEVVSFSGRAIDREAFAKYRNGTQSPVFDKSKVLYGVNFLKKKKQKTRLIEYIIVVEGHLDVVSMHQAGFDTTVGSMGTALTEHHARQLKNYCNTVYISYDGDQAGSKATQRSLDIMANVGLSVKVVVLPDGKDPDDVIRTGGKEAYQKLLEESMTVTAYKIACLRNTFDFSDPDAKARFAVEAVKIIKRLKNPVEQEEYLKEIMRHTGYSMRVLKKQADLEDREEGQSALLKTEQKSPAGRHSAEKAVLFILASLAADKEFAKAEADLDEIFAGSPHQLIYNYLQKSSGKHLAGLFQQIETADQPFVNEIFDYQFVDGDNEEKFLSCVQMLLRQKIKKEKEALAQAYEASKDVSLLKKIQMLEGRLKRMKTDGGHS